jgi:hypothetical protein
MRWWWRHFRCIKPNWDKKARVFEGTLVLEQLRYLGVVDAIKVTRQWFAPYALHRPGRTAHSGHCGGLTVPLPTRARQCC